MKRIKAGVCQICNGPYDREKKYPDDLFWDFNPHRYHVCSNECLVKAHRANGAFSMRKQIKNLSLMTFEDFQKIFNFSEAGGYAKEKYLNAQRNPFMWVFTLDNENFYKIACAI